MKPQDIVFILVALFMIWKLNPKFSILAGLICILLSIPLFQFQIFFTAERLVIYASLFILIAIIRYIFIKKQ
jgi:hypothetical protein